LKAFEAAIGKADAIEMDIHITKDKKLVVYHNPKIKTLNKRINELTLKQIKNYSKKIPLFEDVLKTMRKRIKFVIEIKTKDIEKDVLNLTKKYLSYNDFVFISFKEYVLGKLKKLDKRVKTGLIIGPYDKELGIIKSFLKFLKNSIFINKIGKTYKIDFYGINHIVAPLYFSWAKKNKKQIFLWVVNNKNIRKYKNKKYKGIIAGIISNTPDVAKQIFKLSNL